MNNNFEYLSNKHAELIFNQYNNNKENMEYDLTRISDPLNIFSNYINSFYKNVKVLEEIILSNQKNNFYNCNIIILNECNNSKKIIKKSDGHKNYLIADESGSVEINFVVEQNLNIDIKINKYYHIENILINNIDKDITMVVNKNTKIIPFPDDFESRNKPMFYPPFYKSKKILN